MDGFKVGDRVRPDDAPSVVFTIRKLEGRMAYLDGPDGRGWLRRVDHLTPELTGAELVAEHTARPIECGEIIWADGGKRVCVAPLGTEHSHSDAGPTRALTPTDALTEMTADGNQYVRGARPITVDGFPYTTTAPERLHSAFGIAKPAPIIEAIVAPEREA